MFDGTDISCAADDAISIHGAREHNLKNCSLTIPREQLVVITGVSGSGKSTLAFDLIFAEGQRRFLDSMNVYARQFVEQFARPDADLITGIPPTVSIEQRNARGGGKSTVATVTEIYHFIRLLLARIGTQFCPDCQVPVAAQTRDELGRRLRSELKQRGDLLLLAPVVRNRKGFHSDVAQWAAKHGYREIRADGKMFATAESVRLDRFREHNVEIVTGVLEKGRVGALRRPRGVQPRNRPLDAGGDAAAQRPYHQLIDETMARAHSSRWTTTAGSPCIPPNVPAEIAGAPSSRSIRNISVTTRPRAGARAAAVSANCFTCPRTSIAGPGRTPSPNRGTSGRKASARSVRSARERGSIPLREPCGSKVLRRRKCRSRSNPWVG
jgi:hypothetical protein